MVWLCPVLLLGMDLLAKAGASISFTFPNSLTKGSPTIPFHFLFQITQSDIPFPLPTSQVHLWVWSTQKPSMAKCHPQLQKPFTLVKSDISPTLLVLVVWKFVSVCFMCAGVSVFSGVSLFSGHKWSFLVANKGLKMEMGQTQLNV